MGAWRMQPRDARGRWVKRATKRSNDLINVACGIAFLVGGILTIIGG